MNQLIERETGKVQLYPDSPGILIVDSDPGALKSHLTEFEIVCYTVSGIDEALHLLAKQNVLLALINLKAITAKEHRQISEIAKHSSNTGIPIIIVSPSWSEIELLGKPKGIFHFVKYPEQISQIVSLYLSKQLKNKQLEQNTRELELIREELESLSYSVSHDLRAPLRAVTGFSNVLLKKASDRLDGDHLRYLHMITDNVDKLNKQIDDLLTLSRLTRQQMHVEVIDLKKLSQSVFEKLLLTYDQSPVELQISKLPVLKADLSMMQLMMNHLLDNAIRFSMDEKTPKIEIGFNEDENGGHYYIKDNGVGFEEEYSNKLFQLFQKLHSDEDSVGNGAGLAIVKRIVTRHNGQVWAKAKLGVGTTIFFTIPE
tara:strand:- start:33495 stop:34607 length:1113 start_codon:yes stop_codon:yes gene_type:complete